MHGRIEALGATLVAISPQLPENSVKIARRHKLTFDVLTDAGNAWARQLGLVFALPDELREVYAGFGLDLPKFNGEDSWELPMPARFVVAADGTIAHRDADPDYTHRPEPEEAIELLRGLAG